jgi:hypothetical protein
METELAHQAVACGAVLGGKTEIKPQAAAELAVWMG